MTFQQPTVLMERTCNFGAQNEAIDLIIGFMSINSQHNLIELRQTDTSRPEVCIFFVFNDLSQVRYNKWAQEFSIFNDFKVWSMRVPLGRIIFSFCFLFTDTYAAPSTLHTTTACSCFTGIHKSFRRCEKAFDISHVGGVSGRRMLNAGQRRKDLNFKQQQCKNNPVQRSVFTRFLW